MRVDGAEHPAELLLGLGLDGLAEPLELGCERAAVEEVLQLLAIEEGERVNPDLGREDELEPREPHAVDRELAVLEGLRGEADVELDLRLELDGRVDLRALDLEWMDAVEDESDVSSAQVPVTGASGSSFLVASSQPRWPGCRTRAR